MPTVFSVWPVPLACLQSVTEYIFAVSASQHYKGYYGLKLLLIKSTSVSIKRSKRGFIDYNYSNKLSFDSKCLNKVLSQCRICMAQKTVSSDTSSSLSKPKSLLISAIYKLSTCFLTKLILNYKQ